MQPGPRQIQTGTDCTNMSQRLPGVSMMMVVMMVIMVMPVLFFLTATSFLQGLFEIFVDPAHFLDGRPDITCQRPLAFINQRFLPFAVFAGVFPVMVYPVLQQYFYLISSSHSRILPKRLYKQHGVRHIPSCITQAGSKRPCPQENPFDG